MVTEEELVSFLASSDITRRDKLIIVLASVDSNSDKLEVTIFDPTEYSSLQEHINFLSRQAISLWEEFVIAFYSDQQEAVLSASRLAVTIVIPIHNDIHFAV